MMTTTENLKLYLRRLITFSEPTWREWIIYFTLFTILHIPGILNFYQNDGTQNAYLKFAESILNGDFSLPEMSSYNDMIKYNGKYYLPYPPFPAFILLPLVLLFDSHNVNTVFIALLLSCLNLFLFYKIFKKIGIRWYLINWLLLGFFFGTGYWFAIFTSHHVYSFAHITATSISLLVINELLGKKRWFLVGVLIGLCFLTRQFLFLYMILAIGFLWTSSENSQVFQKWKETLKLTIGFSTFVFLYLVYNYYRFNNPFDTGYAYILYNGVLAHRVNDFGVFSYKYVPFNFYSSVFKGFNIEFEGLQMLSIKDMDLWGTSVLASSPFVVASCCAKWKKELRISAWLTIILIFTGTLFYHNNGFQQINTMRFSLDFMPVLFLLIALGANRMQGWLFKSMIIYAVLLNIISFTIHYLYQ